MPLSIFPRKSLPGLKETLPWRLIPASRNHILQKGNQIDPLLRVFQKLKFTYSYSSSPSKTSTEVMHLGKNTKMVKTLLTSATSPDLTTLAWFALA